MNYQAGTQNRTEYQTPVFEERYQRVVAEALKRHTNSPVLIKPRERIRGWAWKIYAAKL